MTEKTNEKNSESRKNEIILGLLVLPISVIIWILIFYVFYNYGYSIYLFLTSIFSKFFLNIIGVLLVLTIGLGLFWLRSKHRVKYGILEIGFALVSGWVAISKFEIAGYIELVTIVAAIYLVVRGLDNYREGKDEQLKKLRRAILPKEMW